MFEVSNLALLTITNLIQRHQLITKQKHEINETNTWRYRCIYNTLHKNNIKPIISHNRRKKKRKKKVNHLTNQHICHINELHFAADEMTRNMRTNVSKLPLKLATLCVSHMVTVTFPNSHLSPQSPFTSHLSPQSPFPNTPRPNMAYSSLSERPIHPHPWSDQWNALEPSGPLFTANCQLILLFLYF